MIVCYMFYILYHHDFKRVLFNYRVLLKLSLKNDIKKFYHSWNKMPSIDYIGHDWNSLQGKLIFVW